MNPMCIQHLHAPHDLNGNPRRLYVVFDTNGSPIAAYDENYAGKNAIPPKYRNLPEISSLNITTKDYKDMLNWCED